MEQLWEEKMIDLSRVIRPVVLFAMIMVSGSNAFASTTFVSVNEVKAGSMLLATKIPGRHVPAPLLTTEVDISVTGPIARVKVRQSFLNPSRYWLEGRYV